MAPIREKKAGVGASAPRGQKSEKYFFAQKGGQKGSFGDFERACGARKIYYIYTTFIDFQKTLTVIQRRNVGATSTQ